MDIYRYVCIHICVHIYMYIYICIEKDGFLDLTS